MLFQMKQSKITETTYDKTKMNVFSEDYDVDISDHNDDSDEKDINK